MFRMLRFPVHLVAAAVALACARDVAAADPLSDANRSMYGGVQKILLSTAERMPEEKYGFRPDADVRTFAQIVGHAADSQYLFCSAVLGEKNPAPQVEKTKTTKGELIAALQEAFRYCDRAYAATTDQNANEMLPLFGSPKPRLSILTVNNVHTIEHYGNLVTYLRMNDLVPPTSDRAFMATLKD